VRPLILIGRHESELPALLEDSTQHGQHPTGGPGRIARDQQCAELLHMSAPEKVPCDRLCGAFSRGQERGHGIEGIADGALGSRRAASKIAFGRIPVCRSTLRKEQLRVIVGCGLGAHFRCPNRLAGVIALRRRKGTGRAARP
jgi:hypothetical protein